MTMKKFFRKLRYNLFVSHVLMALTRPFYLLALLLVRWISIKVKVNGTVVNYAGTTIRFPKSVGINICSRIYWLGTEGFEPLAGKTLLLLFMKADVFFDIGSNFGFYSVLGQKVMKGIEVFCFEP